MNEKKHTMPRKSTSSKAVADDITVSASKAKTSSVAKKRKPRTTLKPVTTYIEDQDQSVNEFVAMTKAKKRSKQQEQISDAFDAGANLADAIFDIINIFW